MIFQIVEFSNSEIQKISIEYFAEILKIEMSKVMKYFENRYSLTLEINLIVDTFKLDLFEYY